MMTLYGEIPNEQLVNYKKSLHSSIHWLLIYKENNYSKLDEYFNNLLIRLNGLNELFKYPVEMITLMSILQSAKSMVSGKDNFKMYRKLILDAHSVIDKLGESDD